MHAHFKKRSRAECLKNIKFIMDTNNMVYNNSELEHYSKKQLRLIESKLSVSYQNISKRNNPMYFTKY